MPSLEIFCIHSNFGELSSTASSAKGSSIGFGLWSSLALHSHAKFKGGLLPRFLRNIDWFG